MSAGGTPPPIELTWSPSEADFATLFAALDRETAPVTGRCVIAPVALLLRGPEGEAAGGLWGRIVYAWLVIEMLVVPPSLRGRGAGTALIARAEQVAWSRGCTGIQLTRLDFQAPAFYERLGFAVFGVQEDVPPGHRCFYLQKRLGGGAMPVS